MYGPITGLYFQGQRHGLRQVATAIEDQIMPRRPAREVHPVGKGDMPTISLPSLEVRLSQGYQGGHDGATELPAELVPLFKGSDYKSGTYGFAGKSSDSQIHWLA